MRTTTGLLILVLLAGCGSKSADQTVVTTKDGTVSVSKDGTNTVAVTSSGERIQVSSGGSWPATLPAYAPAYPGGAVTTTFTGSTGGSKSGGMVAFTTADAPDRVVGFYKEEALRAGLADVATMTNNGAQMFTASDKATKRDLSVQASPDGGKTSATLTYGMGG